jgi:hypothetical protein
LLAAEVDKLVRIGRSPVVDLLGKAFFFVG